MDRYPAVWRKKKLIVFDLDGTLAKSKQPISPSMARLLAELLEQRGVAVISGGEISRFRAQVIAPLLRIGAKSRLKNLFLFPTTAMSFYRYQAGWKKVYEKRFSSFERKKTLGAFKEIIELVDYHPRKAYGKIVEDRGTQITFSALGQKAPLGKKKEWNRKRDIRPELLRELKKLLPGYEERIAGLTSIDVTKKGVDKAFGIRQMEKYLKIKKKDMLFVGDALYRGGNDAPVKKTGVPCIAVKDPKETERLIRFLVAK